MIKFARKCDVTGRGMNEGYVVGDGELYFSTKEHLLEHLREVEWVDCNDKCSLDIESDNDDELLEFFYNEDYYYYTEWEEIDDDEWYDEDGSIHIFDNEFNN